MRISRFGVVGEYRAIGLMREEKGISRSGEEGQKSEAYCGMGDG